MALYILFCNLLLFDLCCGPLFTSVNVVYSSAAQMWPASESLEELSIDRLLVSTHPPPLSNSAVLGGEGESMEAGGARICTSNKSMLMLLVWAVHFESCHLHHHMNDCWLLYRVDAWIYLVVPLYLGIEIISNANNAGITILRAKPVLCFYERSASLHWDPRS